MTLCLSGRWVEYSKGGGGSLTLYTLQIPSKSCPRGCSPKQVMGKEIWKGSQFYTELANVSLAKKNKRLVNGAL